MHVSLACLVPTLYPYYGSPTNPAAAIGFQSGIESSSTSVETFEAARPTAEYSKPKGIIHFEDDKLLDYINIPNNVDKHMIYYWNDRAFMYVPLSTCSHLKAQSSLTTHLLDEQSKPARIFFRDSSASSLASPGGGG